MKNIKIYLSLFLGISLFATSCKDEHGDDHTAEIVIASPLAEATYNNGDTVFINATITAGEAMHGWELHLKNMSDQSELFTDDAHDHAATYNISTYWVNNVAADTHVELEVIATIDHDGNTTNKKVEFHCNQ